MSRREVWILRNPYLSIVVPAFNEQENIPVLYGKITEECKRIGEPYEILFVDDGSTDGTPDVLHSLREKDDAVCFICLSRNHGHQIALSAGLDHCRGAYALTMDADLQHPPEMIPRFLEEAQQGIDIVSGVKRRTVNRGALKNFLATSYYKIFRRLTSIHVEPNASDFRLYSRKALDVILRMRERERYLRGMAEWTGFRQKRIPYVSPERHAGSPKYTLRKLAQLASNGIFSFSAFPLRISIWIGVLVLVLDLVYLAASILSGQVSHSLSGTPVGMFGLILFLLGLLFFCLGILGEYVLRIYEEVKKRPLYVVDRAEGIEASDAVPSPHTTASKEG